MADNEYKKMVIGFLLFGLFTILLISSIYHMAVNYNVPAEKLNEATAGALNISDYETELTGSDTSAENYRERFEGGEVEDVDDASGIFSVISDVVNVFTTPFTLLANVGENLLGIPAIVGHVILSILNISILFGIWRVLRAGS